MDREEIEDLVYASLGRHLRVTCVLGLLFLGIGFVMGHLVAAQHTRVMSERWAAQAEQLSKQVTQVETRLKAELAKVRELAKSQSTAAPAVATQVEALTPPVIVSKTACEEESRKAAGEQATWTGEHCREQVARCIEDAEREKARIQSELQPFVDRKLTIQATEVSVAVNRLIESQVSHLKSLAHEEVPVAQVQDTPYFRPSDIAPISGESTPRRASSSLATPLLPVPGNHASVGEETTLMPLPNTRMVRVPVAAEPSDGRAALDQTQPNDSGRPRRSIFIRSRKSVDVSNGVGALVQ